MAGYAILLSNALTVIFSMYSWCNVHHLNKPGKVWWRFAKRLGRIVIDITGWFGLHVEAIPFVRSLSECLYLCLDKHGTLLVDPSRGDTCVIWCYRLCTSRSSLLFHTSWGQPVQGMRDSWHNKYNTTNSFLPFCAHTYFIFMKTIMFYVLLISILTLSLITQAVIYHILVPSWIYVRTDRVFFLDLFARTIFYGCW